MSLKSKSSAASTRSEPLIANVRLSGGPNRQTFQWENLHRVSQGELAQILQQVPEIEVYDSCRAGGEHECDYIVHSDQAPGPSKTALQSAGDAQPLPLQQFVRLMSDQQRQRFEEAVAELAQQKQQAKPAKRASGKRAAKKAREPARPEEEEQAECDGGVCMARPRTGGKKSGKRSGKKSVLQTERAPPKEEVAPQEALRRALSGRRRALQGDSQQGALEQERKEMKQQLQEVEANEDLWDKQQFESARLQKYHQQLLNHVAKLQQEVQKYQKVAQKVEEQFRALDRERYSKRRHDTDWAVEILDRHVPDASRIALHDPKVPFAERRFWAVGPGVSTLGDLVRWLAVWNFKPTIPYHGHYPTQQYLVEAFGKRQLAREILEFLKTGDESAFSQQWALD